MGRPFHRYETRNHRSVVSGALARDTQDALTHSACDRDGSRYDAVRESAPTRQRLHAGGARGDRREEGLYMLSVLARSVRFRTAFAFAFARVQRQYIHKQSAANHAATNISIRCAGIDPCYRCSSSGMHDDRHRRRLWQPDRPTPHHRRGRRPDPCAPLHDCRRLACRPAQAAVTNVGGRAALYSCVVFNLAEGVCTSSRARGHWFR